LVDDIYLNKVVSCCNFFSCGLMNRMVTQLDGVMKMANKFNLVFEECDNVEFVKGVMKFNFRRKLVNKNCAM
jgi:hypothetical protein